MRYRHVWPGVLLLAALALLLVALLRWGDHFLSPGPSGGIHRLLQLWAASRPPDESAAAPQIASAPSPMTDAPVSPPSPPVPVSPESRPIAMPMASAGTTRMCTGRSSPWNRGEYARHTSTAAETSRTSPTVPW